MLEMGVSRYNELEKMRDRQMQALAACSDSTQKSVFEHIQNFLYGARNPSGTWNKETWQKLLDGEITMAGADNAMIEQMKQCLRDDWPPKITSDRYGQVMSEIYRRLWNAGHGQDRALRMIDRV